MNHPLLGARAKLNRASETLGVLAHEAALFATQVTDSLRVEGAHSSDGLRYVFTVFGRPEVPARLAVLAGEVVHQLRSALDHVVWALVIQNNSSPTRRNQYPLCTSKEDFDRACYNGAIDGVGVPATRLIESTQPYTSNTPRDTILFAVNELDIIDKHRLLVVLSAAGTIGDSVTIGSATDCLAEAETGHKNPTIQGLSPPSKVPLSEQGSEFFSIHLLEPAPALVATATCVVELTLESCGLQSHIQLIEALHLMHAGTAHTVELFASQFDAPA